MRTALLAFALVALPASAQSVSPPDYRDGYTEARDRLADAAGAPAFGTVQHGTVQQGPRAGLPEEVRLQTSLAGGTVLAVVGWPLFAQALQADPAEDPTFGVITGVSLALFGSMAIGGTVLATYSGVRVYQLQKRKRS